MVSAMSKIVTDTAAELRGSGTAPERVLRNRDILCFSHDWSGDPLSKTHLMRLLARDNRVLWVNSIGYRTPTVSRADVGRAFKKLAAATGPLREPEPNIFVLNPLAIPVYGQSAIGTFNRHLLGFQVKRAMQHLGFRRPINWVVNPAAAVIAGTLGEELLIYYCNDEYAAFPGVSAQGLARLERQLLSRADLVIVSAEPLYQSKVRFNPRTVLVRHGVHYRHFRRALDPETVVPEEIAQLPRPIIGYFGMIADWVDLDLIEYTAGRFPGGSLVLLGKVATDITRLERWPCIHLLGQKPWEALPAYCKGFDVALMPFRVNELTLNANPLKVREYLAAGLPVVSTPIPEVEVLNLCRIAGDREVFVREIEGALADPGPSVRRSEAVRGESWEARLEEIRRHLAALEPSARRADGEVSSTASGNASYS
jgi:glycosyltransferase involved in cell wall biosynthesis